MATTRKGTSPGFTFNSLPSHAISWLLLVLILGLLIVISSRILVLLVLRHEVIHIALGLGELHLVHALARVPVQESLPPEHGSELLAHPPEHLLDGS
uniref:Uncharacterized protein n=1 Tax=Zea mays TaxID=4577 RepID=C4IYR7_MAIZE|nr:unknown [Zea mays]